MLLWATGSDQNPTASVSSNKIPEMQRNISANSARSQNTLDCCCREKLHVSLRLLHCSLGVPLVLPRPSNCVCVWAADGVGAGMNLCVWRGTVRTTGQRRFDRTGICACSMKTHTHKQTLKIISSIKERVIPYICYLYICLTNFLFLFLIVILRQKVLCSKPRKIQHQPNHCVLYCWLHCLTGNCCDWKLL